MRTHESRITAPPHDVPMRTTAGITLLDGFRLEGTGFAVSGRGQRLLALLALHGEALRTVVAGMLWPEVPEERARASLRAAVCEVQRATPGLLSVGAQTLAVAPGVTVDVSDLHSVAHSALRSSLQPWEGGIPATVVDLLPGHRLSGTLLAGWTDDWVLAQRERLRAVRLHAMDAWVARASALECHSLALGLAEAAIDVDPLRESAHRRLMQVHLAQGDVATALHQYEVYQALLRAALGIRPSRLITDLAEKILEISR